MLYNIHKINYLSKYFRRRFCKIKWRCIGILLFIFINASGTLFAQIINSQTSILQLKSNHLYKNHGITKNIILIKIKDDRNNLENDDLYLRINNPHINRIILENKNIGAKIELGDNYRFKDRFILTNDFIIPLKTLLNKGDSIDLFIDKRNENVSYLIQIFNKKELENLEASKIFYLGCSFLFIILCVILFLILGVILRKTYNYYFALFILSMGIWFLNNAGYLYQYCWPDNPVFHKFSRTLFSTITIAFFCVFILEYFKKNKNRLYKIILYLTYLFVPTRLISIALDLQFTNDDQLKYLLLIINSIILTILFIIIISFITSKTVQKGMWFYNIGHILYTIFLLLEVFHQYKFDPIPIYHHSQFFPFLFFCGQIILIGFENVMTYIRTNKLLLEKNYQGLIDLDNDLANTIINVQENERTIIGEEIHDKIGADLSIIKLRTETILKKYPKFEGNEELKNISSNISSLLQEIRFYISSLIPIDIKQNKSEELFYSLVTQFERVAPFNIKFKYELKYNLSKKLNIHLYRILNEMLTNSLKYSICTEVQIDIFKSQDNKINFWYTENTKGFNYVEQQGHFGIKNIKHRVSYIKGDIEHLNLDDKMIYKINFYSNEK